MVRDSPIEHTGRAHLVSVTCKLCDESDSVPETTADYEDENDIPHVCGDCHERIEDLWSDMYIRNQTSRLKTLADYMKHRGFTTKSNMLMALAQDMQKYEPVIRAIERCRDSGKLTRQRLEEQIQRLEEA